MSTNLHQIYYFCRMLSPYILLVILLAYFLFLMSISHFTGNKDNKAFFMAGKNAPWIIVSIGMIGASVSGISFLSVPGMAGHISFLYMQTVAGFFIGYIILAKVLLPVYYKLSSPSIYEYLRRRFGNSAYKTGAIFFLISKTTGTAAKVYIIATVLYNLVFRQIHISFEITTALIMVLIWLYTKKNGLKTIVYTDMLQTLFMAASLILIIYSMTKSMNLNLRDAYESIISYPNFKIIEIHNWKNRQFFVKQFLSGIFIVLVMTGLDQDMIQKNRTIPDLKKAQRNMYLYGFFFIPLNLLFLSLGTLALIYAQKYNITLPSRPDDILPFFVSKGLFNPYISAIFFIGIISSTFSSADSAVTAITTSICIDIANKEDDVKFRKIMHVCVIVLLIFMIIIFRWANSTSLIDLIYIIVSYTYGPLLGLFSLGLLTKRQTNPKTLPYICFVSPVLCYIINHLSEKYFNYTWGYELLLLNGLITFITLLLFKQNSENGNKISKIHNKQH